MASLSYHSGKRGLIGFLKSVIGSDGVARAGVVPAISIVDSDGNPANASAANPATIVTGQLALTAGSRAALPSAALVNGIVITAESTNSANVLIGGSAVTTTEGGSGNGYPLKPGASISFGVSNASAIYAISTAAAVLSYGGN